MKPVVPTPRTLERILVLRTLELFRDLPDDTLASLATHTTERWFKKGEHLIRHGGLTRHTYVVVEGQVRAVRPDGSERRSTGRVGVGVLGMLGQVHARHDVIAVTPTRVLVVAHDRLAEQMEDDFMVLHHLLQLVSREIIKVYVAMDTHYRAPEQGRPVPGSLRVRGRRLDLVERILAVRQVPAFGRSSLDSVARYARQLREEVIPEGTVLWTQGEPGDNYIHVVRGNVVCERREGSGVLTYGPPAMPGLFGVVSGRADRWTSARAGTDLLALRAGHDILFDMLEDDPQMAALCLRLSARRLLRFLELKDQRSPPTPEG